MSGWVENERHRVEWVCVLVDDRTILLDRRLAFGRFYLPCELSGDYKNYYLGTQSKFSY